MDGSERQRPVARFVQAIADSYLDERQRHPVLHAVARHVAHNDADEVLSDLGICEQVCPQRNKKGRLMTTAKTDKQLKKAVSNGVVELVNVLNKAHRSLQFYGQQLKQLSNSAMSASTEHACSICLDSAHDLGTMAILPCSHVFHTHCIRAVLKRMPYCPECRAELDASQISSVVMELKSPEARPQPSQLPPAWKRHGSKLNAIAKKIREIRQEDPAAKMLVFVQWSDLEIKVCDALKSHGLPFLQLGNPKKTSSRLGHADGALLRRFQDFRS